MRQIVLSSADDDEAELMCYRTEPVRVEGTFDDFGFTELYDPDAEELASNEAVAEKALFNVVTMP